MKNLHQKLFAEIKSVPMPLQASYFRSFDGLRGLAILLVLLEHFGTNNYSIPYHIRFDGRTGVHIFFILSGFLITALLLKEKVKYRTINHKYFYMRRGLRILPLLFLFLVVLALLNVAFKLNLSAFDFIGSLLFIKNLPISGSYYTAHLWSLAVEVQFYIIFPLLLMFHTNKYIIITLLMVVFLPIIAIAGNCHFPLFNNNLYGAMLSKFCKYAFWKGPTTILMGSLAAILLFKNIINPDRLKINYFLSFGLLVIALTIRVNDFIFYKQYLSEYISNILIAGVLVLVASQRDFLSKILNSVFLVRIGILSYSLYVWQQLFIGTNTWQPWMQEFYGWYLWSIILLKFFLVFIIARCSYIFERCFLKIKNGLVQKGTNV